MREVDLAGRKDKIMGIIVETYIQEAKPVGSRTIARKLRFKLSPASIRNVMADLEEDGYIRHPYTSAGRIPTDKGYRYYVDNIMPVEQLTAAEKKEILRQYASIEKDLESIMEKTSQLLSHFSEEAGVIIYPCLKKSTVKHVELISLGGSSSLVVLLTNSGMVKNMTIDFPHPFSASQLEKISNFFNAQLEGVYLNDVRNYLTQRVLTEELSVYNLFKDAFDILTSAFKKIDFERLCLEGTMQIISQPEFASREELNRLLRVLEEKKTLLDLMNKDMEEDGIKVHIGQENNYEDVKSLSLVTANYKLKGQVLGSLGVIGPTRMAYSHILSIVDFISKALENTLQEKEAGYGKAQSKKQEWR